MGGHMVASIIGCVGAVTLLVAFAWMFLRTPPDGPQWLVIRDLRLLWCLGDQLRCCQCDKVKRLCVDGRWNSRLFEFKAMLTGATWKPGWCFEVGSRGSPLARLRSEVFRRLGSKLGKTWFCRCWSRLPVGGYADHLVARERELLRQNGYSPPSGDYRYVLGLSAAVAHLPIVREDIADHELVHMIQDSACNTFYYARALRRRSAGLSGAILSLLSFVAIELWAWLFGSTLLCALLMGPPVAVAVWTIWVSFA